MLRCNLAAILAPLLLTAGAVAAADSSVTLAAAPDKPQTMLPYRPARLTITNQTGRVVEGVSVQDARGGVTVLERATIAPGTTATVDLFLPPTSTQQTYRVRLLEAATADSPVLLEVRRDIAWPGDVVEATTAALVDPQAYDRLAHLAPVWPAPVRRNIFLLAGLGCLLLVTTMFIPRRPIRLAALLVVVIAATIAAAISLDAQELLFVRQEGTLTAVSARRTTTWSAPRGRMVPLYAVRSQLTTDTTVLGPGDVLQTLLTPDSLRLFCRPTAP